MDFKEILSLIFLGCVNIQNACRSPRSRNSCGEKQVGPYGVCKLNHSEIKGSPWQEDRLWCSECHAAQIFSEPSLWFLHHQPTCCGCGAWQTAQQRTNRQQCLPPTDKKMRAVFMLVKSQQSIILQRAT